MNKGLKIAIGIVTIGVIGTTTYLVYNAIKKRREGQNDENTPPVEPPANVVNGNENSNEKTPFTNKAQGNLFRVWVNKFYPSYAKSIDLDVSGEFDNSFMRKAWGKYGDTYKKGSPNFLKVKGKTIPENLLNAYNKRKDKGVLGNNAQGDIFLRTTSLGDIQNKPVYAYYYSGGKVNFVRDGKRISSAKWWDDTNKIVLEKKNYLGDNFYNTAWKVFNALKAGDEANANLARTLGVATPSFSFNGNLKSDLDSPARKGIDLDTNIID